MKVIVHHGGTYWCPSWDTVYEFSDCLSYKFPKTYFTEKEWEQLHKKWKEKEKEEKLEELKRNRQERTYYLDVFYAILLLPSIFLLIIIIIKII